MNKRSRLVLNLEDEYPYNNVQPAAKRPRFMEDEKQFLSRTYLVFMGDYKLTQKNEYNGIGLNQQPQHNVFVDDDLLKRHLGKLFYSAKQVCAGTRFRSIILDGKKKCSNNQTFCMLDEGSVYLVRFAPTPKPKLQITWKREPNKKDEPCTTATSVRDGLRIQQLDLQLLKNTKKKAAPSLHVTGISFSDSHLLMNTNQGILFGFRFKIMNHTENYLDEDVSNDLEPIQQVLPNSTAKVVAFAAGSCISVACTGMVNYFTHLTQQLDDKKIHLLTNNSSAAQFFSVQAELTSKKKILGKDDEVRKVVCGAYHLIILTSMINVF